LRGIERPKNKILRLKDQFEVGEHLMPILGLESLTMRTWNEFGSEQIAQVERKQQLML
jgi:hypothetical protein